MHHFLLNCHQRIYWDPGVTEQTQLFHPISDQNTAVFHVHKHYFSQSLLVIAPSQKRSAKVSLGFWKFYEHILSYKNLVKFKGIPVVT